jgi:hypothetical protein
MLEDLTKAEMSVRSYVVSGEERRLESYKSTIKNVREQLAALRKMTVKDPEQEQQLKTLARLAEDELALLAETVELRRTQGVEAAVRVSQTDRAAADGWADANGIWLAVFARIERVYDTSSRLSPGEKSLRALPLAPHR